jgi:hypothetical protein
MDNDAGLPEPDVSRRHHVDRALAFADAPQRRSRHAEGCRTPSRDVYRDEARAFERELGPADRVDAVSLPVKEPGRCPIRDLLAAQAEGEKFFDGKNPVRLRACTQHRQVRANRVV